MPCCVTWGSVGNEAQAGPSVRRASPVRQEQKSRQHHSSGSLKPCGQWQKMLVSPMAERNKELILEVLADYVDNTSQAFGLELASGTGQHVVHFAQALPNVTWQPSEISPSAHESISAYIRATKVQNVKKPLAIDVSQPWDQWAGLSQGCCNVIVIINLLHFLAQGLEVLFQGVGQLLKPGGVCLIYGPFAINGIISPECNVELEEKLQERNPAWGLRDVEELRQLATPNALRLERMLEMPEYTKCLIFRRRELEMA
ncbi:methyltransferase-like 26 B isoform X2 [Chrysemys picta bellii]|uniref:methyltransferase-like 26 B isoform X2 n=2 Tax=Chrysemys picta bellii TaxID=8478 RepID=UPI0032B16285